MKNNHNLKFEQTTFKSQKNKDKSTNTEIQLSLCWLAKNLTGLSGGSHLYLKPYAAFIHWCRTFDYIEQTPSAFWNALFELHRSICDMKTSDVPTNHPSVVLVHLTT
jgi:hypothetical protein